MSESSNQNRFKRRTRLDEARASLLELAAPVRRTETVPVEAATGRVLAQQVTAERPVPHYRRAAMDGYAVRAADTFGASDRSPNTLRVDDAVVPGTATQVHTGSELPDGADAVVMVEHVDVDGDELTLFDAVAEGENVAPVGEDVGAGQVLFDPGHRLRPSAVGLLKSTGVKEVTVYERPEIAVFPTGEELVHDDPDAGEVVETNGLTVSQYVEQWGGSSRYEDVIPDDPSALRSAILAGTDADAVVTTGGSSVGERDILPDIVSDLGQTVVHGIAIKPGHPAGIARVDETPMVMVPGYPVSCIVTAIQLLRPLVAQLSHASPPEYPTTDAQLAQKVTSEPGVKTFVRVQLEDDDTAVPIRSGGAGVLSSVAFADGWVTVAESHEGLDAGDRVTVEHWEAPR